MVSIGPTLRKKEKENKEEVLSAIDLHQVFRFFSSSHYFLPLFPFSFLLLLLSIPSKETNNNNTIEVKEKNHRST
jgi:hypothetical protein